MAEHLAEHLTDELIFWDAMRQVRPLGACGRDIAPRPNVRPPQRSAPHSGVSELHPADDKFRFTLSCSSEHLEGYVAGLDMSVVLKLRAGATPQARLDLHGMTVVQAFEALRTFMRGCWGKNLRTVWLIPGRGRNSPDGIGVLREKLQCWLTSEPCKRMVLAFCTARQRDGGAGCVYVLLRKNRKNYSIDWNRMPSDADLCSV